jgi:hypothetical protein
MSEFCRVYKEPVSSIYAAFALGLLSGLDVANEDKKGKK